MREVFLWCVFFIYMGSFGWCSDFQINSRTYHNQANPAIAMDSNRNFVVVYSSYYGSGDRSNEIFGQRFASDETTDGNEFQINNISGGNQKKPSIAMKAGGNFVVVWEDVNDSTNNVYGRLFDSNGIAPEAEFKINSEPNAEVPKVAMNNDGAFVVVWEHHISITPTVEACRIKCQIFDSNGKAVGTNFDVYEVSGGRHPDVGIDGAGDFIVVWMQDKPNVIMAKRYEANGDEKEEAFEVSMSSFDTVAEPSISVTISGHFLVTWDGGNYNSINNIYARRYKFDGTEVTDEFQVNTTSTFEHEKPKCAINNYREFVIVWSCESEPNNWNILGKRYDQFNNQVGDEFLVNTYIYEDQKNPAVSMSDGGDFVSVWQSKGQDGSMWGVFGKHGPIIGSADFTDDLFVNFLDYCVLAGQWLKNENPLSADLIDDNSVDLKDLEILAEQWLKLCYDCQTVNIFDEDSIINLHDYAKLAADWSGEGPLKGDITGEGKVDKVDLKALILHWVESCK